MLLILKMFAVKPDFLVTTVAQFVVSVSDLPETVIELSISTLGRRIVTMSPF